MSDINELRKLAEGLDELFSTSESAELLRRVAAQLETDIRTTTPDPTQQFNPLPGTVVISKATGQPWPDDGLNPDEARPCPAYLQPITGDPRKLEGFKGVDFVLVWSATRAMPYVWCPKNSAAILSTKNYPIYCCPIAMPEVE